MYGFDYLIRSGTNWHRAVIEEQEMFLAASEVIWRRSLQMMTGTMSLGEATRMVLEKPRAFVQAAQDAGGAAFGGGDPGAITRAAVAPLREEARSNARRLRG